MLGLITLNTLKKYHELVLRITVLQSPVIFQSSGWSAGVEINGFNVFTFFSATKIRHLFVCIMIANMLILPQLRELRAVEALKNGDLVDKVVSVAMSELQRHF